MKNISSFLIFLLVLFAACSDSIQEEPQPPTPEQGEEEPKPDPEPENNGDNEYSVLPTLNVVGRYLKNEKGEIVNLHGFTQTYSPFLITTHGAIMMYKLVLLTTNVW